MPELNITLKIQPVADRPKTYKFVRGSFGPDNKINFSVKTSAGTVFNLTGKTVSIILLNKVTQSVVFDKELMLVDPLNGIAKYEPKKGDFSFINTYYIRLKITDQNNDTFTERVLFEVV